VLPITLTKIKKESQENKADGGVKEGGSKYNSERKGRGRIGLSVASFTKKRGIQS